MLAGWTGLVGDWTGIELGRLTTGAEVDTTTGAEVDTATGTEVARLRRFM